MDTITTTHMLFGSNHEPIRLKGRAACLWWSRRQRSRVLLYGDTRFAKRMRKGRKPRTFRDWN